MPLDGVHHLGLKNLTLTLLEKTTFNFGQNGGQLVTQAPQDIHVQDVHTISGWSDLRK